MGHGSQGKLCLFLNKTNNRLESVNGKLKQVSVDIALLKTLSPASLIS